MCSEAMRCYYNGAFWIKMYSLLGAILFTFTIRRRVAAGATAPGTSDEGHPGGADLCAAVVRSRTGRAGDWVLLRKSGSEE